MNSPVLALRVACAVFGFIGFAHALRFLGNVHVQLEGLEIPESLSFLAALGFCLLSRWMYLMSLKVHEEEDELRHEQETAHHGRPAT